MGFELGTIVGTSVGRDDGIKVGIDEGELLGGSTEHVIFVHINKKKNATQCVNRI